MRPEVTARKRRRGIIEKRRRDRINSSLCELRRLVPSALHKQGSAKLEKAEILQMTVDHLKMLQAAGHNGYGGAPALALDFLSLGFRECLTEVSRYLSAEHANDPLCCRLLSHLTSCASQHEAVALTAASHPPHNHTHTLPQPIHSHHWAAAVATAPTMLRPLPPVTALYRLGGCSLSPEGGV